MRLQDKLGEKNFHEYMRVFKPVTNTIKDVYEDVTKTMAETSKENDKALVNLNKLLNIMNDRGIITTCLRTSKITNPEHIFYFTIVKVLDSNRVNDLLINKTIPVTLYDTLLTFRDTDKKFELEGDLLKLITKKTIMLILLICRIKN